MENIGIEIINRQFDIDWSRIKTTEDVVVLLKALGIAITWHQKECPPEFYEIYDKGFLIERKNNKIMNNEFKPDGEVRIIHKYGQPYGIRDDGGYLLFFPTISKYTDQEERYIKEIQECFDLAEKIKKTLKNNKS